MAGLSQGEGGFRDAWADWRDEWELVFGPASEDPWVDAELGAARLGPPSRLVSGRELDPILSAQFEAMEVAAELRAVLMHMGVDRRGMPMIAGKVDRANQPIVVWGVMDASTARQLSRALMKVMGLPPLGDVAG